MKVFILLFFILMTQFVTAAIINIPNDQPTIQEGINQAENSDTLLVQPGTYYENINYSGKNITIASLFITTQDTSYISLTIIDGANSASVVTFNNAETSAATLSGFTIQHGQGGVWPSYIGGGGITCRNYSNPTLDHLRVVNNHASEGGGMQIEDSNPVIHNSYISSNTATNGAGIYAKFANISIDNTELTNNNGHGIYFFGSYSTVTNSKFSQNSDSGIYSIQGIINFENCEISYNAAEHGAGLNSSNTRYNMLNVDITHNQASSGAGGIYYHLNGGASEISGVWENVNILYNSAGFNGGGVYISSFNPKLVNVLIMGNTAENNGGGIYCYSARPTMEGVMIKENIAQNTAGGIYLSYNSYPQFSEENRSNIFLNSSSKARDIYSTSNYLTVEVVLDTFSVNPPTSLFAAPLNDFEFDILNNKIDFVNSDLYVSPSGSDSNSGLTPENPLKSISWAVALANSTQNQPQTIHLSSGIYSTPTTGEVFPITGKDYISIIGSNRDEVILDGGTTSNIFHLEFKDSYTLKNMTIQNGHADKGGGLYLKYASVTLDNIRFTDNICDYDNNNPGLGGGLYCRDSRLNFNNLLIENNTAQKGGGIYLSGCKDNVKNSIIRNNQALINMYYGGGAVINYSNQLDSLHLDNVEVSNNINGGVRIEQADFVFSNSKVSNNESYGIYLRDASPTLDNLEICNNTTIERGGGINCYGASPTILNSNIHSNYAQEEGGGLCCYSNSNPTIINTEIQDNTAKLDGGGIYIINSSAHLDDVLLQKNISEEYGGGIHAEDSEITILNSEIKNNCAGKDSYRSHGGGLSFISTAANMENCKIHQNHFGNTIMSSTDNYGAGICLYDNSSLISTNNKLFHNKGDYGGAITSICSSVNFNNTSINRNIARKKSGGLYAYQSDLTFNPTNRSSIYFNSSLDYTNDISLRECNNIEVILDSVTVANPDENFITTLECSNISYDFNTPLIEQVSNDLYVSPLGSDFNDGSTIDSPLKSISTALLKLSPLDKPTSYNIHLGEGIYSESTTNEVLPLNLKNRVNIVGKAANSTIVDGEGRNQLINFNKRDTSQIELVTLRNGYATKGGAAYVEHSLLLMNRVIMENNEAYHGGAVYGLNSNLIITNSTFSNNNSITYGSAVYGKFNTEIISVNNIFWPQAAPSLYCNEDTGVIAVSYCDIQNGSSGVMAVNSDSLHWLNGNISEDPQFVTEHDFNLEPTSPCRNNGVLSFTWQDEAILNIDYNDFMGTNIDMGAMEYSEESLGQDLDINHFQMLDNYPNPFSRTTSIVTVFPKRSKYKLSVYNIKGQLVKIIDKGTRESGVYKDELSMNKMASGVYIIEFSTSKYTKAQKCFYMKSTN